MYTQCPDCGIAFKVSADVLKQAAGMVRCGGCGDAFNALSFLSESMPQQGSAKQSVGEVPELTAEIIETDSPLPKSISAKQSAALLKTLDELAGSDIRIEDTGVEWRVLDDEEVAESAADDVFIADADAFLLDEVLDASETPIDEVLSDSPEVVDSPEIFEAKSNGLGKTSVDEIRFDDNTPLPDDFDLDDESSYVPQPLSQPDPEPAIATPPRADFALSEPEEWTDILDEFEDLGPEFAASADVADERSDIDADVVAESTATAPETDEPPDVDTQFALQAEEMGIDLSGIEAIDDDAIEALEKLQLDEEVAEDDSDDSTAAPEADNEDEDLDLEDFDVDAIQLDEVQNDDTEDGDTEGDQVAATEHDVDAVAENEAEAEADSSHLDVLEAQVEPIVQNHTIEEELAMLYDDEPIDEAEGDADHYVAPLSEEEHTINMQIDQDLMALAIEDQDGFASTIVATEESAEIEAFAEHAQDDGDQPGFETIIMEGEFVRSALEQEEKETDPESAIKLAELVGAGQSAAEQKTSGNRYALIGGVAGLVVLFAIQMMHQSREALATIPAFNSTVGQIYSAIGQPVHPAWDITGWRIEATSDTIAVNDGTENLTISSRIGNNSDTAMPYPLVSISLSDRFLETIGSQILEPSDYLPTDLDPGNLVAAGSTFNAVMSIESPASDATGYKLDVCYRLADGRLRCAVDDFK